MSDVKSDNNLDEKRKHRAVVLLSGGLDSAIAAKMIKDQGIEVFGLNFHSPFCICNNQSKNNQCGAVFFSKKVDIPMKIVSKGDDYLDIIKNPKFGYGKNLNPCIDCRIHILKKAKEYADEIGAEFLITGDVLGQRPKSQTMRALKTIEKESGLEGLLLRPLSAHLLPETIVEKKNIVNRAKLLNIQGRRRNVQVELGKQYKLIKTYCANGGCRLTDKNFANRLRDYLKHTEKSSMKDMKWLKLGRHFRYEDANNKGVKIICGKNESENKSISSWAGEKDAILEVKDVMGPSVIIFAPYTQNAMEFAAQVAIRYSDSDSVKNSIKLLINDKVEREFIADRDDNCDIVSYRI